MAWNMKDYPASMKNLDTLVKKKAIEIAMPYSLMIIQKIVPFQLQSVKQRNGITKRVKKKRLHLNKQLIRKKTIPIAKIKMRRNYWMLMLM